MESTVINVYPTQNFLGGVQSSGIPIELATPVVVGGNLNQLYPISVTNNCVAFTYNLTFRNYLISSGNMLKEIVITYLHNYTYGGQTTNYFKVDFKAYRSSNDYTNYEFAVNIPVGVESIIGGQNGAGIAVILLKALTSADNNKQIRVEIKMKYNQLGIEYDELNNNDVKLSDLLKYKYSCFYLKNEANFKQTYNLRPFHGSDIAILENPVTLADNQDSSNVLAGTTYITSQTEIIFTPNENKFIVLRHNMYGYVGENPQVRGFVLLSASPSPLGIYHFIGTARFVKFKTTGYKTIIAEHQTHKFENYDTYAPNYTKKTGNDIVINIPDNYYPENNGPEKTYVIGYYDFDEYMNVRKHLWFDKKIKLRNVNNVKIIDYGPIAPVFDYQILRNGRVKIFGTYANNDYGINKFVISDGDEEFEFNIAKNTTFNYEFQIPKSYEFNQEITLSGKVVSGDFESIWSEALEITVLSKPINNITYGPYSSVFTSSGLFGKSISGEVPADITTIYSNFFMTWEQTQNIIKLYYTDDADDVVFTIDLTTRTLTTDYSFNDDYEYTANAYMPLLYVEPFYYMCHEDGKVVKIDRTNKIISFDKFNDGGVDFHDTEFITYLPNVMQLNYYDYASSAYDEGITCWNNTFYANFDINQTNED